MHRRGSNGSGRAVAETEPASRLSKHVRKIFPHVAGGDALTSEAELPAIVETVIVMVEPRRKLSPPPWIQNVSEK